MAIDPCGAGREGDFCACFSHLHIWAKDVPGIRHPEGTMGCCQAESRMVCGHGRAQAWWEASGKQGQHQACGAALGRCHGGLWACFVAWCLPIGAGKLCQAPLPSFAPFSTGVRRKSRFTPPGAALPLLRGGTTTCRDSHRKGAAEGPCYPDLEQCRPSPLSCLCGHGDGSLPFLLPSAAESTSLPCKQIVLLCSGGSCTSGRLIWERHQL